MTRGQKHVNFIYPFFATGLFATRSLSGQQRNIEKATTNSAVKEVRLTKTMHGFAILAALTMLCVGGEALANPPATFSVSLNEKGGYVTLHDGKTDLKVDTLSLSVNNEHGDRAQSVQAILMWPDGARDEQGEYKLLQRFDCRKHEVGGKVIWTADVERMRADILDTSQGLACYFEFTMDDGRKRYLRINSRTFTRGEGFAHVDESLNVAIGVNGPREDNTHAIGFVAKPSK